MSQKIIVPLDQSHVAECAVPYARALARQTGLPITLLSVIEPSPSLPEPPAAEDLPATEVPPARNAEHRYSSSLPFGKDPGQTALSDEELDAFSSTLSETEQYLSYVGESITETRVENLVIYGDPVEEIVRIGGSTEGDPASKPIIVMASHGRSGLGRLLLGSVALKVAERAACPMLLVRALATPVPSPSDITFSKVVVAVDGSHFSEAVMDPLQEVFGDRGAHMHLVRVVDLNRDWVTGQPAEKDPAGRTTRDDAEQYLTAVSDRLRVRGNKVSWDVVDGRPAEWINRVAEESAADVIALTTHGYSGLKRLAIGSVAEDVLHRAKRPVFLVRPPEEGASGG